MMSIATSATIATPQATAAPYVDKRRITEQDADFQRLHARTVRELSASLRQFANDLRSGESITRAQSAFIHRHVDLMRAAYLAAHAEGQRDYWQQMSATPHKQPIAAPDEQRLRQIVAWYSVSVAKMAQEAVSALQAPPKAQIALSDANTSIQIKHTGVMVAFMLKAAAAKKLAIEGGEPTSDMHLTLAFLGESGDMSAVVQKKLRRAVATIAAQSQPLKGTVSGVGRFNPSKHSEGKVPVIALTNVPGLQQWRAQLVKKLKAAGVTVAEDFEYTPHITLAYIDTDKPMPIKQVTPVTLEFDRVTVAIGDERFTYSLGKPSSAVTFAEVDVQQWQDSLAPRVTLQADLTWAALNDGYVQAGGNDGAAPYTQLWWNLGISKQHCTDCPALAAFSPYGRPGSGKNELYQTPGDGRTQCGAGCNCTLSYGFDLEAYENLLDWRDSVFPREVAGANDKFIRQADVAQFAAGNAPEVPDVGYHYGTAEHIDRLMTEGVDVTRNFRGMYGQGFYMYDRLQPQAQALYGDSFARIAIRMQNPLIIDIRSAEGRAAFDRMSQESAQRLDWAKAEADANALRAQATEAATRGDLDTASQLTQQASDLETEQARRAAAALSSSILEQDYDGIIIRNTVGADVRDQFVAIKPGSVRVISDEAAAREGTAPLRPLAPPEKPDALTTDQKSALDDYRSAQLLWGEVAKGLPQLPDLFTLASQYRNEESLATALQHWTLSAAQQDVLARAYDALLNWNDAVAAMSPEAQAEALAQQARDEQALHAAQNATTPPAPTVRFDSDAARMRTTHVFPTDPTDEQVANLAGAPPGSTVEVDRTRQITVTHADGTITSTIVFPQAAGEDGPQLMNWRYQGADGTNRISVDPEVLARQVRQAYALGIDSISMKARDLNAEMPSNDAWWLPQLGYDTTAEQAALESKSKALPPGFEDATMLSDVLATEAGRIWWLQNGRNPTFIFNPRPGSYSWRVLDALLRKLGLEGLEP